MQKEVDPTDPLRPKFRNYPVIVRATKAMNHACLWLFGFKLVVRGQEHAQAAYARKLCPVVVCNHISFLDIWLIGAGAGSSRRRRVPPSPPRAHTLPLRRVAALLPLPRP